MARFILTRAHELVVSGRRQHFRAGTLICDGTSCSAGDVVVSGLTALTVSNAMSPVDAGGTTMLQASRFNGQTVPYPDGANSIQP
jgi:hypothetical protein